MTAKDTRTHATLCAVLLLVDSAQVAGGDASAVLRVKVPSKIRKKYNYFRLFNSGILK